MNIQTVRNFLIVLGCYWLSMWVILPFAYVHGKITIGVIYSGYSGAMLMHIITAIPLALVSFGAGVLSKYVLEDSSKNRWILLLALLYAWGHFFGFHWAIKPELSDQALQFLESIIPAITCYIGSIVPFKTTKQPSH
jgi:hypothetical protein